MVPSSLRLLSFLGGLAALRFAEVSAPHHPPTVPLLRRWTANLALGAIGGGIVSLACAGCVLLSTSQPGFAVIPRLQLPGAVRIVVELVVLDLLTYLLHRAYHASPLLWRLHLVHHTDLDLDVSSASRFHPGEVVVSAVLKLAVVFALGISAIGLVVFEAVMLACAQFQHSNIRLPVRFERWLWRTVVPPEMHRLHHSPIIRDTNSNYGTILTLWDRCFGTLNARARGVSEPFGLTDYPESDQSLLRLLQLPGRRVRGAGAGGAA